MDEDPAKVRNWAVALLAVVEVSPERCSEASARVADDVERRVLSVAVYLLGGMLDSAPECSLS